MSPALSAPDRPNRQPPKMGSCTPFQDAELSRKGPCWACFWPKMKQRLPPCPNGPLHQTPAAICRLRLGARALGYPNGYPTQPEMSGPESSELNSSS